MVEFDLPEHSFLFYDSNPCREASERENKIKESLSSSLDRDSTKIITEYARPIMKDSFEALRYLVQNTKGHGSEKERNWEWVEEQDKITNNEIEFMDAVLKGNIEVIGKLWESRGKVKVQFLDMEREHPFTIQEEEGGEDFNGSGFIFDNYINRPGIELYVSIEDKEKAREGLKKLYNTDGDDFSICIRSP